jgi:hypothetical protein
MLNTVRRTSQTHLRIELSKCKKRHNSPQERGGSRLRTGSKAEYVRLCTVVLAVRSLISPPLARAYTSDLNGRLSSASYANGATVNHAYDTAGNLLIDFMNGNVISANHHCLPAESRNSSAIVLGRDFEFLALSVC